MKKKWLVPLIYFVACFTTLFSQTREPLSFSDELATHIHVPKEGRTIGRIVIDDRKNGITEATWLYVHAALNEYKKTKPACIILELNTPGGEVYAAQRISDALKEMDTQYGCPIIAYINNWAISAGAMLAYSCRFIVIAKDASMGAAEPVLLGEGGKMEAASEKINSALRADFANRAKFFERNGFIAEAMVDKDVILVLRDGKIIKLESEDQIYKEGEHPDVVISPKGKLLTLNAEQLMQYKVADALLLPQALEPITEEEESQGKWSLAKSPFSQIAFFKNMEPCEISTFSMDWQTRFMAFLALPQVSSLLFLAMVICFYLEMNSPGVTLPAVVGTLCLFFIILSSFALQAVHWLEPILFFFGVFLALAEIFVLPTAGILAVLGGLFMLVGLLGMMIPGFDAIHFEGSNLNAAGEYVLSRLGWFSGALLIAAVVVIILSRYVKPRVNFFKRIVLQDTELLQTGVHRMQAEENVPHTKVTVGDFAHVAVTLRPAGKIVVTTSFGALEIDAQSTGAFIEKGSKVHVVKIEGEKIFVE